MQRYHRLLFSVLPLVACGTPPRGGGLQDVSDAGQAMAVLPVSMSQTYKIVSVATGQVLDVVGISQDDGAEVQQYTYGGGGNQAWRLVRGSQDDSVGVISVHSGKSLDIPFGSLSHGTKLQQWSWWNGIMQNWRLLQQPDGAYEIVNLASGLCLDVIAGGQAPGTRVQQWDCWGGPMQRWQLVPIGQAEAAQTPAAAVPETQSASPCLAAMDFAAAGNLDAKVADYGDRLQHNKGLLEAAIDTTDASPSERALVIAMAMLETTYMDPSERDGGKDGTPSANLSILNLNIDMVRSLGYAGNDAGMSLNDPANLGRAVFLLLQGLRTWGVPRTLNFQRGGRTAFNDGISYGAADYRNTIASLYAHVTADPSLMRDGRRIELFLQHV